MKSYFTDTELTCKCGCGLLIKPDVALLQLNTVRHRAGIPFTITSATRCPSHNTNEGGSSTSDHLTGEGFDIRTRSSYERYKIIEAAITIGIRRIGIAHSFVHLGMNESNPQEVSWLY